MAWIEERGEAWVVRWRDGGRGSAEHQRTFREEWKAQKLLAEIRDAEERGQLFEPGRSGEASRLSLILREYVLDVQRRRRPGTALLYAQVLQLFGRWAGDVPAPEAFSFQRLSDYHAHLAAPETGRHLHRRGPETIRKHVAIVEGVWKWAWQRQARGTYHGVPQPDSLELERQPAPHKLAPTWAQMDATIESADGWLRDLLFVLRCTGLRVSQALGLRWEDLHLDDEVPWLHFRGELGKSRQERRGREIPIAPVLARELAGWGRREGFVVPCGRTRREARARDADRAWARAGVPSNVWKGCGHHAFRAGFETGLKRLGADDEAVEFLVGHALGDVRSRYVDPYALPLVEAVRLVPEIGMTEEVVRRFGAGAVRAT